MQSIQFSNVIFKKKLSPGALVKFHVLVQDSFVGLGVHLKTYHKQYLKQGVIKNIIKKIFETSIDQISYQEMA